VFFSYLPQYVLPSSVDLDDLGDPVAQMGWNWEGADILFLLW
jgi:hypothetical protein